MKNADAWSVTKEIPVSVTHALRTAVAAAVSYFLAHAFQLPEAYWSSVSSILLIHPSPGTPVLFSMQPFAGTAVGAAFGAAAASCFPGNVWGLGVSLFIVGLTCAFFPDQRLAYQYAGVTLVIVMLTTRSESVWLIATLRFVEVSVGVDVGLLLATIWPERHF